MWLDNGRNEFNESSNTNVFIADPITFNEQWSTQIGINNTSLESKKCTLADRWGKAMINQRLHQRYLFYINLYQT